MMRFKGVKVSLAVLAVLALVAAMLINLQSKPRMPEYDYAEVVSWFQQNRVQEYSLDLNSAELYISRMDGKSTEIRYRVPHVGYFLEDTDKYVFEWNQEHPETLISGNYKRG